MILDFQKQNWCFISTSIKKRKYAFLDQYIREICTRSFFQTAYENNYLLACFVLMPEHIHFLSGSHDSKISEEKMAKDYKGAAARRIFSLIPDLKLDIRSKHFWTNGCDKKAIDSLTSFRKIVEYILLNPYKKQVPSQNYSLYLNSKFLNPEFIQGLKISPDFIKKYINI